mmetsp:Transcript_7142/g.10241  ORF Transcript_7142/g.10241 Transcript_7142/m.10241 type:complete len:123 (+) Transcript_7142:1897-2265(+)
MTKNKKKDEPLGTASSTLKENRQSEKNSTSLCTIAASPSNALMNFLAFFEFFDISGVSFCIPSFLRLDSSLFIRVAGTGRLVAKNTEVIANNASIANLNTCLVYERLFIHNSTTSFNLTFIR